jgi:outer membrane protein TolC
MRRPANPPATFFALYLVPEATMPLFRSAGGCAMAGSICALMFAGCASSSNAARQALRSPPPRPPSVKLLARDAAPDEHSQARGPADIKPVSYEELAESLSAPPSDGDDPFAGEPELPLPLLVAEVQRRNQSLQAALAAWGAAAQKYPQVIALDDPTLQTMVAPASISPYSGVQASYIIGVGQKLPWWGKRELRGDVALWNAAAASRDYEETQIRLAAAARLAYYDYYSAFRQLEVNDAGLAAVQAFRDTARSKFEANQVTQQDVLQADVELAQLEQRRVEIEQMRQVAAARINTLLHREPQLPLPIPVEHLNVADHIPDDNLLRVQAVENRPELGALVARLRAEQNALALMCKEYYPDFEIMGKYDSFWTDPNQRGQVALNLNIPLNAARRQAAVEEAIFRVRKMQADYNQQVDTVRNEVQAAYARLAASRRTLELYDEKLLPASRDNVAAATSGYTAGTIDFLRLIQAQREFIDLNEKYQAAIADYHRNQAELDLVVGILP